MRSLTKQTRLLQMMAEIDNHAIILLDKHGIVETWNKGAEKIKGYQAQEIIGKNFRVFYSDSDSQRQLPEQLLAQAASRGKACHEGWRLRKDKTRFWGDITITALHDPTGQVIGFAKITRDLTERRQAETSIKTYAHQLEKQNKELEQFVYIASHDLQEPLLNVINFTHLLQEEYAPQLDDTASQYLTIIDQSTQRMRSLIRGLLDYSRLGREKLLTKVDCQLLLDTLTEDLSTCLTTAGAIVHYTNLPTIEAYALELRQLFDNLISNAITFRKAHSQPKISIWAENHTSHWTFAVRDNGIGIDPAHTKKIFLLFQRLHSREAYPGNGLGLAQCQKIVEAHAGKLWVESVLGEGSTFFFTIPIPAVKAI